MRSRRSKWQPFKRDGESPVKDRCGATRKARFRSKDAAAAALDAVRAIAALEGNSRRREQRYYYCRNCDGFHLTSQDRYNA